MGTRVHQLAKELGIPGAELIPKLQELGIQVKSGLNVLKDEDLKKARGAFAGSEPQAAPPKSSTPKKAAPKRKPAKPKAPAAGAPAKPKAPAPKAKPRAAAPKARPGAKAKAPSPKSKPPVKAKPAAKSKPTVPGAAAPGAEAPAKPRAKTAEEAAREVKEAAEREKLRLRVQRYIAEEKLRKERRETKKKKREQRQRQLHQAERRVIEVKRPEKLELQAPVSVKELSTALGIKANEIIRKLFLSEGMKVTINDPLEEDKVLAIGLEHGCEIEVIKVADVEEEVPEIAFEDKEDDLVTRAPVVAFLGHVDHGKTSLLDRIRKSTVAEGESGGITQHIGAYRVDHGKSHVVFLDTPGHEAFTSMRARGADVTDVVALVVAADDGVMPQTIEAINHARAAEVKILVALNKIDKASANVQKTMQQLAAQGLNPVAWGGDVELVEVSAVTGAGLDDLLETLSLEAEILDLKANPKRPARGTVIEAHVSEGRGNVAHVLIRDGTLRRGDVVLCGPAYGKVKALYDDQGNSIDSAEPSTPVEITGLSTVPEAGDRLVLMRDLKEAARYAQRRQRRRRDASLAEKRTVTLDNLFSRIEEGKAKEVRVIVKADVKGSLEPLKQEMVKLGTDEVKVKMIHSDVGGITESDVMLADASEALLIGFHVVPDEKARLLAEERRVEIRTYQVIYEATGDIRKALEGLLEPEKREEIVGHLEIREVFRASKVGRIAGCHVLDGRIERGGNARLTRDSVIIYTGKIDSVRRFKEDVKEVREGFDCGVRITGYDDIQVGDVIETFQIREIARTLD